MYPAGNLLIPASHGQLEAIVKMPTSAAMRGAAVVCHPHPLGGGTMHNKVVFRAAAALIDAGLVTLRFNFRGVGNSTGAHDEGRGEMDDVRTALDYLSANYPNQPITLAGFSFGSRFGTEVGVDDARVVRLISIGTPVDKYRDYEFLRRLDKPILFVQGDRDEFGSTQRLQILFDNLPAPDKTLIIIPNSGHFFDDTLNELRSTIATWTNEQINRSQQR